MCLLSSIRVWREELLQLIAAPSSGSREWGFGGWGSGGVGCVIVDILYFHNNCPLPPSPPPSTPRTGTAPASARHLQDFRPGFVHLHHPSELSNTHTHKCTKDTKANKDIGKMSAVAFWYTSTIPLGINPSNHSTSYDL